VLPFTQNRCLPQSYIVDLHRMKAWYQDIIAGTIPDAIASYILSFCENEKCVVKNVHQ
jgi:hypothetical protein